MENNIKKDEGFYAVMYQGQNNQTMQEVVYFKMCFILGQGWTKVILAVRNKPLVFDLQGTSRSLTDTITDTNLPGIGGSPFHVVIPLYTLQKTIISKEDAEDIIALRKESNYRMIFGAKDKELNNLFKCIICGKSSNVILYRTTPTGGDPKDMCLPCLEIHKPELAIEIKSRKQNLNEKEKEGSKE